MRDDIYNYSLENNTTVKGIFDSHLQLSEEKIWNNPQT